jgi:hypothetical protein
MPPTTMEGRLSLASRYLDIISKLIPTGTLGIAVLLASTAPSGAHEEPGGSAASGRSGGVGERLAAIREAVSAVAGSENGTAVPTQTERQLAWGNWGNGFYVPVPVPVWPWSNWNNWHDWNNWGNYWRNW